MEKTLLENEENIYEDSKVVASDEKKENISLASISAKLGLGSVAILPAIAEHKKKTEKVGEKGFKRPPRLEDNLARLKKKETDEDEIVSEEDGSKYTNAKAFFKNHWKKVVAAGAIIGGAALIYNLLKQGQVDTAQEVTESVVNTAQTITDSPDEAAKELQEFISRTDVGKIGETFYTNDNAANNVNSLTPNEYHQNEIINAVTSDNEILPADDMGDVLDYASEGKDITSLQVGDQNGIDGHVNKFDGEPLDEVIKQYQRINDGGNLK